MILDKFRGGVAFLLLLLFFHSLLVAQDIGAQSEKPSGMTLACSMSKQTYAVGEIIPLRIEIRNRGDESLLLVGEIPDVNQMDQPSFLAVRVLDLQDHESPSIGKTGESRPALGQSDAVEVASWWILLEPDSFYGKIVLIQPSEFRFLRKTGRYKLQITFSSTGGYPPAMAARLVSPDPKVPKMPYPIWTGKLRCSSDWFEIKRN